MLIYRTMGAESVLSELLFQLSGAVFQIPGCWITWIGMEVISHIQTD